MFGRMTVISGIKPDDGNRDVLTRYVHRIHSVEEVDLILTPGADIALADEVIPDDFTPQKLFALQEILKARAFRSWQTGSRACLIVAEFSGNTKPSFEDCIDQAKKGRELVRGWHIFQDSIFIACRVSGRQIQTVSR